MFVGPPEASDGERLGSIRFDPFSTNLHKHLSWAVRAGSAGAYDVPLFSKKRLFNCASLEEDIPSGDLMLASISTPPLNSIDFKKTYVTD